MDHEEPAAEEFDTWPFVPRLCQIPSIFHSLEFDGPFQKCLLCQADLSSPLSEYMIERIFRGTEPIVEYAICLACQKQAAGEMSTASMQAIQGLFAAVDHEARSERLRSHLEDGKTDAWIDECLLTGKRRSECKGYQIITKCSSTEMELGVMPFMLSDDAAKQIAAVISQQTRGHMDDFMDHFGMPPEFSADPDWMPIFL